VRLVTEKKKEGGFGTKGFVVVTVVKVAYKIIPRGFIWPVAAYCEWISRNLIVDNADISL
jgi:hypothetical protein